MRYIRISLALSLVLALLSCSEGGQKEPTKSLKTVETVITGLSDEYWTYFSLESGQTVGTSVFLSEEEDALWAGRKDWDFAICGDYFKTNSGSSGSGLGGVQLEGTSSFYNIAEAPAEGYLLDDIGIVR